MGKTVGAILIVAAVVAINFIPGVGQAVTAGLISAGLGAATAATVTTALTTIITSAALGAVSMLLTAAPKLNPPETMATALKTSTPPRVSGYGRSRLYGAYALFTNTTFSVNSDTFAPYAIDVFAVHDGRINAIVARYLGDDLVTLGGTGYVNYGENGRYGGQAVRWLETMGATPGTAQFPAIQTLLPGNWDNNHRGDGVVALGLIWKPVSSDEFSERFPQGAAAASIVGEWQFCPDPRLPTFDPSDTATWVWTENAALHLLHYRLFREKARRTPGAAEPSPAALQDAWDLFFEPTRAYWETAANDCDAAIALAAGGTEPRYRSCFAHKHTDPHKDVIDALTQCFDGWTSPRPDGALVVYAGKFYEPTVSIGPDEIVSYSWQYGVVDEESLNELKITYISAAHDYNVVDADAWVDLDDMLERGAVRSQGMDYQVPSHSQARRLSKRLVARIMSANRGVITTNVAGRIVRGHRYINLRIEEAGAVFFDGVAEITGMTRNMATGGVSFSWVEVGPNIDAWNAATEEGSPAPLQELPVLVAPDAPVVDSATLIYDQSADGSTGARVAVSLSGPSGDDLIWYARWRVVDDPVWNEQRYTDVDSSAGVELITDFVPLNENIEIEVAYRNGSGGLSPWSFPATQVDTDTQLTVPDAAPAAPTLVEWTNKITLSCDPIPRARSYRWRFYLADGVTLKRTLTTTVPTVSYSSGEAHADGISRSYKVDVAGVNAAGTGTASPKTATLTNAAPAAVTGVAFADHTSASTVTFTASGATDLAGYRIAYSTASGFNPMSQGSSFTALGSPAYTPTLPAATYYGKVAAYDLWSSQPDMLTFSAEDSFVITPGSGGDPPPGDGGGGGTGGGGGGGGNEN